MSTISLPPSVRAKIHEYAVGLIHAELQKNWISAICDNVTPKLPWVRETLVQDITAAGFESQTWFQSAYHLACKYKVFRNRYHVTARILTLLRMYWAKFSTKTLFEINNAVEFHQWVVNPYARNGHQRIIRPPGLTQEDLSSRHLRHLPRGRRDHWIVKWWHPLVPAQQRRDYNRLMRARWLQNPTRLEGLNQQGRHDLI